MEISKEFRFEASHVLPHHPGKCSNLHGHSWVLTVYVKGPVDQTTGMVQDYSQLKAAVQPIVDDLDHAHLGAWNTDKYNITMFKVPGRPSKIVEWLDGRTFNPTSENLLLEIAKQLLKRSVVFSKLTLNETCTTSCTLTWKEFQEYWDAKG